MRTSWRALCCLMAVALSMALGSCGQEQADDIIILYTNDVHCDIEENIGYAGLADYRALCLEQTPFVTLVDCGDAAQGELIGVISNGEYLVDIMNEVGYDLAVPGNHEFDYGMEQTARLIERAEATYLACNISYSGSGDNALAALEPYQIIDYGPTAVAFIGVATPRSLTSSNPALFMEDGQYVYDFCHVSGETLYSTVQGYVDECRAQGADYVILLAHLGDNAEDSPFTSVELIENTSGVDAVLDGHAHSVISCRVLHNAEGQTVLLSSTGTKLANIGQLVITANGHISAGLISDYPFRDHEIAAYIDGVKAAYELSINMVAATSDIALSCADEAGLRLVRNRETPIGNLCADAFRAVSGAEIALINGGGIRADLPQGDISFSDIIAVLPYGNTLCVVEASGQEILDALEAASRFTLAEVAEKGNAVGEDGAFLHPSGLTYTINVSIPSGVVVDEHNMFISVDGPRRITDVMVQAADGSYQPIDPQRTYRLASNSYLLKDNGDGMNMFSDNELLLDEGMADHQVLTTYINDFLHGELADKYAATENRINIRP